MKTYYLDTDFKVHVTDDGTMLPWEDEWGFFDGKCDAFIEGYRIVPKGSTWVRKDGVPFVGQMIAPWKEFRILQAAQEQYEADLAEKQDMQQELDEANSLIDEIIGGVEDVQQG